MPFLAEARARVVREGGRTLRMTALRDITERKQREEELKWRTAFFEAQVHSAIDGILVVDSRGKKLLQNQRMGELWGIPQDIVDDPDDSKQVAFVLGKVRDPRLFGEKVAHLYAHPDESSVDEIELKDGRVLDRYSAPVRGRDGTYYGRVWTFHDISDRKRVEKLSHMQKQVLEMIARDAPISDTLEALLRVIEIQDAELPCSILLLDAEGARLRQGAARRLPEAFNRAMDGLVIGPCAGSCGAAAYLRQPVIVEDIATDPIWSEQREMALAHGLRASWSTPICDERQQVLGVFAVYHREPRGPSAAEVDVVELAKSTAAVAIGRQRAREALRNSEAQLRQSQKMESFGQLAGGVAHDFNNILAVIQMQAGLLKSHGQLSTEQARVADEITATVERAAALTRQLLLFSRREAFAPRALNLSASILNMTQMLRRTLGETIDMRIMLSEAPMVTHADAGMMDQVVLNLAVNARDAMPKGGRLVITTSAVEFDDFAATQFNQARPGSFVCLAVSDTGCGIPAEVIPRIFEPFFTTKAAGRGTGLGLATVFGIVQQHQGWISVYSEVGLGTTFKVYLPRLDGTAEKEQVAGGPMDMPRGRETILLVEDELPLRESIRKTLTRLGYQILEAPTGVKALEVWKLSPEPVRLLLTDMIMPDGMTGKELAKRLLELDPALKVIYMSGYSSEVAVRGLHLEEGVNFLAKPFAAQKLAQVVRDRLDEATS